MIIFPATLRFNINNNTNRGHRWIPSASSLTLLALFTASLLISGCGGGGSDQSAKSSADSRGAIDETVSSPVTIDWWHFWTDPTIKPTIDSLVAEFQRENPNITVAQTELTWANGHEKLVISLSSGTGPDLMELGSDWIPEFVEAGRLANLTANLSATRDDFVGWGPATKDQMVYAQPWILGTRVVFYNTELLLRAGYDTGFVPITLTHFKAVARAVNHLGNGVYGWGSNASERHRLYKKFLPFFWTHGASFYSENGEYCVVSSQEAKNALADYKELHDCCSLVDTQRRLEDAFLAGKLGIILSGDWLLKRIKAEKPDLPFVTSLFPGKSVTGVSFLGGEYLSVNEDSKAKGAALKLLRFITLPENQVRFCKASGSSTPASVAAASDSYFSSDVNRLTFIMQAKLSKAPPFEPTWVYIEEEFEEAVERVLFENMEPYTSLHIARGKIQKISRGE